jgi:hypothetical protein
MRFKTQKRISNIPKGGNVVLLAVRFGCFEMKLAEVQKLGRNSGGWQHLPVRHSGTNNGGTGRNRGP